MDGFRSLGDEEEVEFECKPSDKGLEATIVTGIQGEEPKGSHRRPMSQKKAKKIRCYNCGDFGTHVAAKCSQGPQPKKCHHCKSADHLIAECPKRKQTNGGASAGGGGKGSGSAESAESTEVPHEDGSGDAASSGASDAGGSTSGGSRRDAAQSATSDLGSEEETCFHSSEDQEKTSDK